MDDPRNPNPLQPIALPANVDEPDTVKIVFDTGLTLWVRPVGQPAQVSVPMGASSARLERWFADRTFENTLLEPAEMGDYDTPDTWQRLDVVPGTSILVMPRQRVLHGGLGWIRSPGVLES